MKKVIEAEYKEDLIRKVEQALEDMLSKDGSYTANISVIIEVVEKA